jgi:glycine cleavage system H protein
MADKLTYTYEKFTFEVATDRLYNAAGVWAKADDDLITTGVSDFFQQRNGDVAFAEIYEVGTAVSAGEPFADIETIKLDIELPCPVTGQISAVNERLELEADLINQDPYGEGWLAIVEADNWEETAAALMTPQAYLEHIKIEAEAGA